MCEGTSHIIICLITALGSLLELRHDEIIASLAVAERSHSVMDFLTSVGAENYIPHLLVDKIKNLVI